MFRNVWNWRINWHSGKQSVFPSIITDIVARAKSNGVKVFDCKQARGWHLCSDIYLLNTKLADSEARCLRESKRMYFILLSFMNDEKTVSYLKSHHPYIYKEMLKTKVYIENNEE